MPFHCRLLERLPGRRVREDKRPVLVIIVPGLKFDYERVQVKLDRVGWIGGVH